MSNAPNAISESGITSLPLVHRGKVRDIHAWDADHLLIVTTDRLSAFDVVLPQPIPGKGAVLTTMSNFWMKRFAGQIPNHLTDIDPAEKLTAEEATHCHGRAVVVEKLAALPVEAVVRGFLIGSGWKDYQATGRVCGIALPGSLHLAEKLPEPIFTPASKAAVGDHDENIDFNQVIQLVGADHARRICDISLWLYSEAASYARSRGIIIADTKFEFGIDKQGRIKLIDEALTPDSSRFWPADEWRLDSNPPSFDKQFVRDYLETLDWDKTAPGPALPQEIIDSTASRYAEAQQRLTGTRPE